jgi:N-acetylneuraminic acid mutarotase
MGGSDTASASGIYGSLGVAAASNVPGARFSAVSWKDSSGNLWLFGGIGVDSTGAQGPLNDLWKFNPTNNQWTWMSGSSIIGASESGQSGVYGTQGVAAASNVPGARFNAVGWTDSSGNLWLFGGCDDDSTGHGVPFNDLWEFNSTTKEWTWVGGSSTPSAVGVWVGTPSTSNIPSSRYSAVSWADDNGNFWLFGGVDNYSAPVNDLWEYTPTTKEWTRVSGSSAGNTPGSYGTLGVASTSNVPGSRWNAVSWIDTSGNLWLFGGWGVDSADNFGDLNDLWEFSPSATTWTWVKGSSTAGASGEFGTLGVAAAANVPCARNSSVSWTDTNGNLWLFGGQGNGAVGTTGDLSDLWEFSTTTKEWTWASGSDTIGASGVYGTLGVASASNIPGGRYGSVSWTDDNGNLWLFGGASNSGAYVNDLWRYQP